MIAYLLFLGLIAAIVVLAFLRRGPFEDDLDGDVVEKDEDHIPG